MARRRFDERTGWARGVAGSIAGALAIVLGVAPGRAADGGAPIVVRDVPCPGCLVAAPPDAASAPLLVVLHGDDGSPRRLFEAWRPPALERGVVVFAPKCPASEGCAGSWWRWAGDPRWLVDQIDAVSARWNIDRARIFVSGWSGGATYLGRLGERMPRAFSAINLSGGGAPPATSACSPCPAPVYYLMGDRNPLFDLAVGARDYLKACKHELAWELLEGANHEKELARYTSPATMATIVDWLLAHARRCDDAAERSGSLPDAAPDASPAASSAPEPSPPLTKADGGNAEPLRTTPGCLCRGASLPAPGGLIGSGLAAAAFVAGARRRRFRRRVLRGYGPRPK